MTEPRKIKLHGRTPSEAWFLFWIPDKESAVVELLDGTMEAVRYTNFTFVDVHP